MSEDTTQQTPAVDTGAIERGVAAGLAEAGHPGTATVTTDQHGYTVHFTRSDGVASDKSSGLAVGFEHKVEQFIALTVTEIGDWFKKADAAVAEATSAAPTPIMNTTAPSAIQPATTAVSGAAEVAAPAPPSNAEAKAVMTKIEGKLQNLDLLPTTTATWFKNALAELKSKL